MPTTAPLLTNSNAGTQDGIIVDNSKMRLPADVGSSLSDDDIISEFDAAEKAIEDLKNKGTGGRRRGSRSAKKRLTKRKRNKKSNRRRKSRRVN